MSHHGNGNGSGNDSNDRRDDEEPLAVRIARELESMLHINAQSVDGVESVTAWPLRAAVIAVAIAKIELFKDGSLGIIAGFNGDGTPAGEVFGGIELPVNITGHGLLVQLAVSSLTCLLFDEMRSRLSKRAGGKGDGKLLTLKGGKDDGASATG